MDLTTIREPCRHPEGYLDKEVNVGGWVRSLRDSKVFGFIVISGGNSLETLQIVYHDTLPSFAEASKLSVGITILVKGTLVSTPQARQFLEIQAAEVTVKSTSSSDYPLQKKRHSLEYLRTISRLRAKTNAFQTVFRVRSLVAYTAHQYFQERDFVYVHTPLITGSGCERAGEMLQVITMGLNNIPKTEEGKMGFSQDFFDKATNPTVSEQLNVETYAMAFHNVYTSGPTFHAEDSNTTRHATESWMIESEVAFVDLDGDMCLTEGMLKYTIRFVLEHTPEEMNFFNQFMDEGLLSRLHNVSSSEFGHITHTEAVEILEEHSNEFDYKVSRGCDLQTEHERYLTEQVFKKPVFVTDYPKEIKVSYIEMNPDSKTVAAVDCLVPGIGEIIGGSQREDDYGRLVTRTDKLGLKKEDYDFYLDLRRYGSMHHVGFGPSFERCVMYLIGISNVRDAIPFPRAVNNCEL